MVEEISHASRAETHNLRHTAATLLLENDTDLKIIQERLRRSQYSTTADLYAHVTKKASRATADKFNQFDPRPETRN
ncbi:tyrosine-type recombinase/integrase [Cohnella sp. GCM10020058]|uniref:tyrosine-type recombinase/integrase n=1 Tax=Cohnella sp. GCM10020058 TaxID=3317330 RepID=UPI0036406C7E